MDKSWQVPVFAEILWKGKTHRYAVVIPVKNEGSRLHGLLERMGTNGISSLADIVLVDGASTDGSIAIPELERQGVRGVLSMQDPGGLSSQLRCAYAFCLEQAYDGIVTIDGNNKDDPAAIPTFIAALEAGFDFAQASRFIDGGVAENTPRYRHLAIKFISTPLLATFAGFRWTDPTQGFRAYSSRMLLDSRVAPFRNVFTRYELLPYLSCRVPRLGFKCKEIPTARRYPKGAIPTKIGSFSSHLGLLKSMVWAASGRFSPKI